MAKKKKNKEVQEQGKGWLLANLNFVIFITILGLFYIANANSVEKKMRKIENLKKEVKEAKYKYIKVEKDIQHPTTASELEKQLESQGLKVNKENPIVLNSGKS